MPEDDMDADQKLRENIRSSIGNCGRLRMRDLLIPFLAAFALMAVTALLTLNISR